MIIYIHIYNYNIYIYIYYSFQIYLCEIHVIINDTISTPLMEVS